MPRPPPSLPLLHQRRRLLFFPHFLGPLSSLSIPLCRSVSQAQNQKKRLRPKFKRPCPIKVWLPDLPVCRGCGIPLQNTDQTKPGFIYRPKDANRDRVEAWKITHANRIFERAVREADQETLAKLTNPTEKVKEIEERGDEEQKDQEHKVQSIS